MNPLGRLERIANPRSVWPGEASHFTPWLAQPENIALLAETLGLGPDGLEVEAVELNVGPFRADIVARDLTSAEGDRVLIENMFGRTDHDHLGKLITYASGLKARTIILMAEEIREEHRSALDWLNQISDDRHQFFALSIELWRIGDSLPAPRFTIVVKPNDWERLVEAQASVAAGGNGVGDQRALYLRYWAALGEYIRNARLSLRPRKPLAQQWTGFAIGATGFELNAFINANDGWIRAELTMGGPNGKDNFARMRAHAAAIAAECPFALDWEEMPDKMQSRVSTTLTGIDLADTADWPRQHAWLAERLGMLDRLFRPRISGIIATSPAPLQGSAS